MKAQHFLIGAILLGLLLAPATGLVMAQGPGPQGDDASLAALGTAFTYQGRLKNASGLVTSTCDFQFSLWDAAGSGSPPTGGNQVGSTQTKTNVSVSEGLFTVELDFGTNAFFGDARWLQIAMRCPAGSGTYTTLSPRQPLTAAPYALALRPGVEIWNKATSGATWGLGLRSSVGPALAVNGGSHGIHVNAVYDGVHVHQAGSPSTTSDSAASSGFEVAGAQGYGLYVGRADLDGVYVNSTEYNGVHVASAGGDGVGVDSASWSGVYVASAGGDGVNVNTAGDDGVYVHQAGSPGTTSASTLKNGFEVAGAEGHGLYVGQAGADGVNVDWASDTGVYVDQVGNNGMYVDYAANDGMYVNHADDDGVYVHRAGSPSTTSAATFKNGFEVAGAQGYGLYVGRADMDGVAVNTAGGAGVYVNQTVGHGFQVNAAGSYGVYADTSRTDQNYGLYTPDNIYSLNYHLAGATMLVAQSGASGDLEPGDVVAVSGTGAAFAESESPVALVQRAGPGSSVMGVVYRRYVAEKQVDEVERDGKMEQRTSFRTTSTEGPIAPGDYLLVVVLGPAQVKVEAASGAGVRPGDPLTAAPNGQAAKAAPVKVGEVSFYAPGTIIGQAMGTLDESESTGLVWMLVMPR